MKPTFSNIVRSVLLILGFSAAEARCQSELPMLLKVQRENWKASLERQGYIDRSLPAPYRVAMPLMSFGDRGPKVMFTYAPTLPGTNQRQVFLLFIKIPID
jgi:hypothetical protein